MPHADGHCVAKARVAYFLGGAGVWAYPAVMEIQEPKNKATK